MTRHLDDMRHYICLSEASVRVDGQVRLSEDIHDDFVFPDAEPSPLLEDINNVIFKLQSYRLKEGSEDYAEGVEEGLAVAANLLMGLIERHGKSQL